MVSFIKQKFHNLISDKKFSEILTGSAWALGARVVGTGISLITSIVVARIYGSDILGIIAILNSFLVLITIFTVLGTNTSILRLIPEHLSKYSPTSAFRVYRKTQFVVVGVSMITGGGLYFASGFIADSIFFKPHLRFYFALAACFIIFQSLMRLNTAAIRGLRLIRVFAFMQIMPAVGTLVILVPLTIFFYHKDNPIYATFVAIAVTALVGAWIMDRMFKQKMKSDDAVSPLSVKKILSISLPMLMTATMSFVIGQTGVIMLGMFRPAADVGYYSIAVHLASLTAFLLAAINTMSAPKFAELYHNQKIDELFYVAKKSTKLIFWVTSPILFFLILIGKPALTLFYGSEFSVAYWPMVFLTLGQFANSISGSTGYFMNMTGNQHVFKNVMVITALVNVSLNIFLIPWLGIKGAALTAMFCYVLWNTSLLVYIKQKYGRTIGYFPLFDKCWS
ncbi:flippase [Desulfobacter hydrogenophilus]|uniref:Flippase n=1 Tax=Desulfobacter hydrogenophilus TaxID=2291 RepID=A0A328FBI4_9BACT|nr:flippase [Desulfobacter hydrogenophilus]NDY72001.1 flippase [Desulfobacter hydrogenophilus]QBH15449.1 flippase [Desulfobacter hydrogenophilus]RAM02001.1 flippase [Desulfobacter hydrogenophilus]